MTRHALRSTRLASGIPLQAKEKKVSTTDNDADATLAYTTRILGILKRLNHGGWLSYRWLMEDARDASQGHGHFDPCLHAKALGYLVTTKLVTRWWTVFGRVYQLGAGRYA